MPTATRPHALPSRPDPKRWLVFGLVATAVFMSTLDGSIVNLALPVIMTDLGVAMDTVKWVMMVYLLVVSSLLLVFGRLSDIRGRRWVYCRGFLVFAGGSLLCAWSGSAGGLIAARALQGMGAAMLMACSPALLVDSFPAGERGRALGMLGTAVAAGLTTGPALGGWILAVHSWQMIFLINIPIGLASAGLATVWLRGGAGDRRRAEPFDGLGAMALAVCLAAAITIISQGWQWGWRHPASWSVLVLLGVSAITSIAHFRRAAFPVFEPALLRIRLFVLPVLASLVLFACLFAMLFLMPFFLMHAAQVPVERAGAILLTPFVVLFFIAPLAGSLYDRMRSSRLLCTAGMGLLALALFGLAGLPPRATPAMVVWRLALAGVGTALFTSPNNSLAMGAVPARLRGVAAAMTATARNLGMVLGVAMASQVFHQVFGEASGGQTFKAFAPALEAAFMEAFRVSMTCTGGVALGGCLLSLSWGTEGALQGDDPDVS